VQEVADDDIPGFVEAVTKSFAAQAPAVATPSASASATPALQVEFVEQGIRAPTHEPRRVPVVSIFQEAGDIPRASGAAPPPVGAPCVPPELAKHERSASRSPRGRATKCSTSSAPGARPWLPQPVLLAAKGSSRVTAHANQSKLRGSVGGTVVGMIPVSLSDSGSEAEWNRDSASGETARETVRREGKSRVLKPRSHLKDAAAARTDDASAQPPPNGLRPARLVAAKPLRRSMPRSESGLSEKFGQTLSEVAQTRRVKDDIASAKTVIP